MSTLLHYDEFVSPIGRILFATDGQAVCSLDFSGYESRMQALLAKRYSNPEFQPKSDPLQLRARLEQYFDGRMNVFDDLAVNTGGTPFQEQVWKMLREIPSGHTWSYGQLAARLGRPQASRAVGRANGLNPVAIIVPCHRVIGASNALVGYGGGLHRKEWLLRHEGALARDLWYA